ncbi:hypothetical protein GCM10007989_37780 [Devosia pacifica]|uniref:DUF1036 domain-containing protein n=1 Tax=Devosia pacifica TaxID=1335967 RepID=A0A918SF84_9HYPH|nr:DUF1036 domain-containing protein [Devosia pacifica]GHA38276.1 hypothetical protein GCM10007989_37780 [Devosia pacifica]
MLNSTIRAALLIAGLAMGALTVSAAPARADLRVCNETSNLVSIAFGYRAERGWQSEGWWRAPAGDCRVIFQGDLERRYFYIFAVDDIGGGSWSGSVYMCTRDESFTIFGVEDCLARGYERTGFFEIDTQNRTDWTLQLSNATSDAGVLDPAEDGDLEDPSLLVDPAEIEAD